MTAKDVRNYEASSQRSTESAQSPQSGENPITNTLRQMPSRMKNMNEATIPDAFRDAPKFISPGVHRWLDIGVTAYFAGLGIALAVRGKPGAAAAAFINAAMVGGVSAFTDYWGTGEKPINFKMHGTLDAIQAVTAAIGPSLHGFAGKPRSAFFYAQAANELGVIAFTDWDAGMPAEASSKAA